MSPRLLLVLCVTLVCCSDDTPTCVDLDNDGFGEGCTMGADCDDNNAARTRSCMQPAPDCAADPSLTGCPCLPGVTACFPGSREEQDVGLCRPGRAICINGHWGLCSGSIAPTLEFCDGSDQDCDGEVDEGARSACGGCTPGCIGGLWGEDPHPFEADEETALTDRGWLTLGRTPISEAFAWVANSAEDTLSRLDDETFLETGRFQVGDDPSRVAVDYRGDGWVLSRAFGAVGSLHHIAQDEARCIDRNDDGRIQTSSGARLVRDDECIIQDIEVGGPGDVPRAFAIDGSIGLDGSSGGGLWIGLYEAESILHLDGGTLEVLHTIPTPGFQAYAFAFDSWGVLWGISRDGRLLSLDRHDPLLAVTIREVPIACFQFYGLAIDDEGRIAITGFGCDQVTLYDPVADHYMSVPTPPSVRGAVADGVDLFVAHTGGQVSYLTTHPFELRETYSLAQGIESIGIGLTDRHIWVASSRTRSMGDAPFGVASVLDRVTGGQLAETRVGATPHTQGDLTGAKRRSPFTAEGSSRHIFDGCPDGQTRWGDFRTSVSLGGGEVQLRARQAPSRAGLTDVAFEDIGTLTQGEATLANELVDDGVVEVELLLTAGALDSAPRVRRVGLEWQCEGPD